MARVLQALALARVAQRVVAIGLRDTPIAADSLLYLDGPLWTASSDYGDTISAVVPGDLVSDLANAGRTAPTWLDLTWRTNATLWDTHSWSYATTFTTPAGSAPQWLIFDGVKLAADITLNGQPLGSALSAFVRYTFPVSSLLSPPGGTNTLNVTFPPTVSDARNDNGRYSGCSGGWDWAPYSNEATGRTPLGIRTFSKGIWKSVYLAAVGTAAVTNVKPLVRYTGAYPSAPLTDGTAGGWRVDVLVYMTTPSPGGTTGTLTALGGWGGATPVALPVTLPGGGGGGGGESVFNLSLPVPPGTISLWWPNGLSSSRPLYTVDVTFTPSNPASPPVHAATRKVGFRTVALVTADDTNPAALAGVPGSGNLTMRLKVNGADIFARGANWIPLEETEGRGTSEAHRAAVQSAADAGMNILRVWGGGQWPYDALLDACDAYGVLLYVDAMYASQADSHHFASGTPLEATEIAHQVRRIASHPSIALWDACNECGGSGVFVAFVAPLLAVEDPSRPLWPASPSSGWADGVDRLWGYPLPGTTLAILEQSVPVGPAPGCNCTAQVGARYFGFPLTPFNSPIPVSSEAACCAMCTSTPGCAIALYDTAGCQLLAPPFAPVYAPGMTALFPPGHGAIPAVPQPNVAEQHGPYQGGGGWPTVNGGGPPANGYDPELPPSLAAVGGMGVAARGTFTSEFGVGQPASFEIMGPTLNPTFWSMHGGHHPADNCTTGSFQHACTGGNPMAQRNYGCDAAWVTFFPPGTSALSITLDDAGAEAFAGQLYLCQLVTAIKLKSVVEWHRSENLWGLLTWQLGEVWPTYGWGSLEYSSGEGSVTGGRWKPSHYILAGAYGDQFVACGKDGRCYVKHDGPLGEFAGTLALSLTRLADGTSAPLFTAPVALPAGANSVHWACADGKGVPPSACTPWSVLLPASGCAGDGSDCILVSAMTDGAGRRVTTNVQLLTVPGHLKLASPAAQVTFTVGQAGPDGTVPVVLHTTAPALYVTLFTLANGRFSDNVLLLVEGDTAVSFMPFSPGQEDVLTTSLRVEHLQKYFA